MESAYCIAGLGNPGVDYVDTRHNAGFLAAEELASHWGVSWRSHRRFRSLMAQAKWRGRNVVLCRPQTFMNRSGEALGQVVSYYRVPIENLLVVVDDADLPVGRIRLKPRGSCGGHHGLESVDQHLGSSEYPRLRIGIGRTETGRREITQHVLGRFDAEERDRMEPVFKRVTEQIECWLIEGVRLAMNRFNGTVLSTESEV